MRCLKWISMLLAFLLMFTVIPATVAEDGIILDAGKGAEESLEIEMDGIDLDGPEAIDDPSLSLEDIDLELADAEDVQLIPEVEIQPEECKKSNDSSDFEIDEDGELTRYRGFDKNVVIPDGVKAIGYDAFANATLVESVIIPDSVIFIGGDAFCYCTGLKSIVIPDSVTEVKWGAFYGCTSLKSVQLSKSLKILSERIFSNCDSLEAITLPSGITDIEQNAFEGCDSLESVTIPASVTSIDRDAFSYSDKVIIRGTAGSYAEYFANAVGIPFNAPIVSIDEPSLNKYDDDYILYINQSCTLTATQKPDDLAQTLSWTSSDNSIATVDQNGTIKGVSQGRVTITANTADGKGQASQISIIVPEPTTIELSYNYGENKTIILNQTSPLRASRSIPYQYITGAEMPISWSSSDRSIISIESTENGMATLKGNKLGKATITATTPDSGTASIEIEVIRPKPNGIKIDQPGPIFLYTDEQIALTTTLTPVDAEASLTWDQSDFWIARVDQNGVVTGISEGWGEIYVRTDNGCSASIEVQVVRGPESVALDRKKATLGVKEKQTLKAIFTPSDTAAPLTWKSSKPAVATVSKTGKITAKKAGKTVITVTTANGKTAKATVTVMAAPKKVTLNKSGTVALKKGKKLKLKATLPKKTASALTWKSSKPKVASVDQSGTVIALKKGTAVITVKTFNGKTAKVTVTVK